MTSDFHFYLWEPKCKYQEFQIKILVNIYQSSLIRQLMELWHHYKLQIKLGKQMYLKYVHLIIPYICAPRARCKDQCTNKNI